MQRLSSLTSLRQILVSLFCAILLVGCSGASKQVIDTSFEVPVENASIKRITKVTDNVDIQASGKFKAGTFYFKNSPIVIPEETSFKLTITAPIKNPSVISTKEATGTFETTKEITFGGVEVPKTLKLQSGKVEVFMDFAKCFSAFLIGLVQIDSQTSSMNDMVDSITLQKVVLDLRPGSTFELGKKTINIGKDSMVELTNVKVDNNLDYRGQLSIDCKFMKDCNWIGDKLDCEFEGGDALLVLEAVKSKGVLTLSLPKEAASHRSINLKNCLLKFGKEKRSSTQSEKGVLELNKFQWKSDASDHPTMKMDSDFDLFDTNAVIRTDIHQTTAHFPKEVPGSLIVSIEKNDKRSTHFNTTDSALADNAKVTIEKKNSLVSLKLKNVDISKASYDKSGTMQFNLNGSKANVEELSWNGKGKDFILKCGHGSTLLVPKQFLVEKQEKADKTKVDMPMKLSLGSANLKSGNHSINLANLKGDMTLTVGEDVLIMGDLDFGLPDLHLLTDYKAQVQASGIKVAIAKGKSVFLINNCSLKIPDSTLEATLKKKIPSEFHIDINKKVQEKKEWRYRNAFVKEVNIKDFAIHKMNTSDDELVKFSATGKATSYGTVEKSGIILSRKRWNTKPWSMSGVLKGDGELRYNFLNPSSGKKPRLKYNLSLNVAMPEDVDLDWSKVSGGMIKLLERKAIVKKLRTIKVPIKKEGEIDLFKKESPFGNSFSISSLKVIDGDNSTKVSFRIQTKM